MNLLKFNVLFSTMIMLKTNFKKFSGNSKEDTFKSSSTMKVVDQKPINREIQSQSEEKFRAIGTNIQSQLKKKKEREKKRKKEKEKKIFLDNIK